MVLHLRDGEQRFPPVARQLPLLPDHVLLLLGRQDATVQVTAGRRVACGTRTESDSLPALCTQHCLVYGIAGILNRTQSPAKQIIVFSAEAEARSVIEEERTGVRWSRTAPEMDACCQRTQRPGVCAPAACLTDARGLTWKVE